MTQEHGLKIIKAVCDAESRGFSLTKHSLNKLLSKRIWRVALTIIEEIGLFIIFCIG